jgi:hypothetical protein
MTFLVLFAILVGAPSRVKQIHAINEEEKGS